MIFVSCGDPKSINYEILMKSLKKIKLFHTEEHLSEVEAEAEKNTFIKTLSNICENEIRTKDQKSTDRRHKSSRIGKHDLMENFDWSWPTSIDKEQITALLDLSFTENAENVILLGPEGLGKTMIAKNLAWRAMQNGQTAYFVRAAELVNELGAAGHRLELTGEFGVTCVEAVSSLKLLRSQMILALRHLPYMPSQQRTGVVLLSK
mgnify:CR=1 FL=1